MITPNESASPTPNCGGRFARRRSLARAVLHVGHNDTLTHSHIGDLVMVKNLKLTFFVIVFLGMINLQAHAGAPVAVGYEALKLVGQFAVGVLTAVASDQALAWINEEQESPIAAQAPARQVLRNRTTGYAFTLEWQGPDAIYSGRLTMNGVYGRFHVTTSRGGSIIQDMLARPNGHDVILTGSNPREFSTGQRAFYYSPDRFRLSQASSGLWTIQDTCDLQGVCAPVKVVQAVVF